MTPAVLCCRNNKLGLDEISVDGVLERLVEEVHVFAPITSAPISTVQAQGVAVGISHTALLTGKNTYPDNVCEVVQWVS